MIAAAVIVSGTHVQAECISPPPPCEALKQSSIVVLADVLDATIPKSERRPGEFIGRLDVRLRVVERFKGIPKNPPEITASIPFNAETIFLEQGQTYLVYANVSQAGNWQTSCTRTRPAKPADDELRVLRQCQ
jgi:hypothetical protein